MPLQIEEMLTCPFSLELVRDPVMVVQSNQSYDRERLCTYLLSNPTRCPMEGIFPEKLQYVNNLALRQLLVLYKGDGAYQKYDDSEFRRQYDAMPIGQAFEPIPQRDTLAMIPDSYKQIEALLCGMSLRQINYAEAQRYVTNLAEPDAVVAGFKALLLHPRCFQSTTLCKAEEQSQLAWEHAGF